MAWAGGLIDWNAQDPKTNGYYYAMYQDVNVQCYAAPSGTNSTGSDSYIYTNTAGIQSSIAVTNDNTILKSLLGTGTDMNKDYPDTKSKSKASGTKSAAAAATSNVATVPGLTGAGPGTDGTRGGDSTGSSGNSGSDSSGGSSSSTAAGSASTGIGGFTQGDQPSSKSSSGAPSKSEEVLRGSIFAVLVAFVGMLMM